ncbi:MAG TPA: hypothetical protein VF549_07995 [Solirubrobacteraceae bacterium]|jgi:hypothetical protein
MRLSLGALAAFLAIASPALAADGLDRTYNRGVGMAFAPANGPGALTPDGRGVFVADGVVVRRLRLDGRPDPAFGDGGTTAALVPGVKAIAAAAGADGSVAVLGRDADSAVAARVRPDGSLRDVVDLGAVQDPGKVAMAPDGVIYVVHDRNAIARIDAAGVAQPAWAHAAGTIAKLRPSGSGLLVASTHAAGQDQMGDIFSGTDLERFAADGSRTMQYDRRGVPGALLAYGDGALLSVYECALRGGGLCGPFGFGRHDARGARTGVVRGNDGEAVPKALAVEPDGDVLLGGYVEDRHGRSSPFYVRRYTRGRRLDRSFGRCGGLAVPVFGDNSTFLSDMAVQPSGRIVGLMVRGLYSIEGSRTVVVAARGGTGRSRLARPVAAARTAAARVQINTDEPGLESRIDSDVPARVSLRAVITAVVRPDGSRGGGNDMLAAEGLPRVAARASRGVGACSGDRRLVVRLDDRVETWLLQHPQNAVLHMAIQTTARNAAGRATGRGDVTFPGLRGY